MRRFIAFAIAIEALTPTSAQYSDSASHEVVRMASALQCGDREHGGTEIYTRWEAPPLGTHLNAPQPPGESPARYVQPIENATAGTFGLVTEIGREGHERTIVLISYRATAVTQNCAEDDDEHLAPYPPRPSLGRVHRGFYDAYASIRKATFAAIDRITRQRGVTVTLFVLSGHSMGAAMLTYLAMELRQRGYTQPVSFYGYGSPRQGDADFATAFRALDSVSATHVWHRGDPVPECALYVPDPENGCTQYARGFRQAIRTTAWYYSDLEPPSTANSSLPYVLCESDSEGCGPRPHDYTDSDHLYYMGECLWCCDTQDVTGGPYLSPAEGGPPLAETITRHCHNPMPPNQCNPGRLHEPPSDGSSSSSSSSSSSKRALLGGLVKSAMLHRQRQERGLQP